MIDYNDISERKIEAAQRLCAALYGIRKLNVPRLEQRTFEELARCVSPTVAYRSDRDASLPCGRPIRSQTLHNSKVAVVVRQAHRAVVLYWDLVRCDETIDLDRLIERLEYYAAHDFRTCELLGGSADGYTLYCPPVLEEK